MTTFSSRRLAILLVASLALNLFLAGVITARLWHGPKRGDAREAGGMGQFRHKDRPVALEKALAAQRDAMRERRTALGRARRNVGQALERDPFQVTELEHAFKELRSETLRSQELLHAGLSRAASKMTRDERRRMAKRAARRSRRGELP